MSEVPRNTGTVGTREEMQGDHVADPRNDIGHDDAELPRLVSEVAQLRAEKDGLWRLIDDLRAQVASLRRDCAAVDPQEHAVVSAQKELLQQQLDDRIAENGRLSAENEAEITRLRTEQQAVLAQLRAEKDAEIAQLRAEKDAEIARLQAVSASQLARLEAAVQRVALFTSMTPALEAREVEIRTALVADEAAAAKELPPQPWGSLFDATVARAPT